MPGHVVRRVNGNDEIRRGDLSTLMQVLKERMLAIGSGRTPDNRAGRIGSWVARSVHALAVTLHVELLQERGEMQQVLSVRQHRMR